MKSGWATCLQPCASDLDVAVGAHRKPTSVAVLIHGDSQWPNALRTANALLESGATVNLFCLGYAPMTLENPMPNGKYLECYADACQLGMGCISLNEIADKLKHCDLVIPL